MQKFFSLCWFHLRLFAKNGYFFGSMFCNTLSIFLLQYISGYASGNLADPNIWLRAGIFGMWTCATTAAGSIGFQRFQGTLPYLLNNATSDFTSLSALIVPSASFGLLSFPISWFVATILGLNTQFTSLEVLTSIVLLWIGAVILDFGIAAFFVLTPNALVYEELILIPLMLLSGLFPLPDAFQGVVQWFTWLLPISAPIQLLLEPDAPRLLLYSQFVVSVILCFLAAYLITRKLLRLARETGKIGVIS